MTAAPEDDYRELADVVIAALNPPEDDVAEFHIVAQAVQRAAQFAATPCQCTPAATNPDEYATPCARCLVLGRRGDQPEER